MNGEEIEGHIMYERGAMDAKKSFISLLDQEISRLASVLKSIEGDGQFEDSEKGVSYVSKLKYTYQIEQCVMLRDKLK